MTTPAMRPRSRSETFWSGATSATDASSTATELPISRTRLAAAVPVTTTSSSCSAWEARKKFWTVEASSATVTSTDSVR